MHILQLHYKLALQCGMQDKKKEEMTMNCRSTVLIAPQLSDFYPMGFVKLPIATFNLQHHSIALHGEGWIFNGELRNDNRKLCSQIAFKYLICIAMFCHLVCNVSAFAFQGQGKYTNNGTRAEVGGR